MKAVTLLFFLAQAVLSSAQINLGAASSFAVLSKTSVTNTGPTELDGDLGTAGTSITGFPPGTFTGTEYVTTGVAAALNDADTAYTSIANLVGATILTGDLGGTTLAPGTYSFSTSAAITGTLILAGTGSNTDAWYFQIGTSLTTSAGSSVLLTNGAVSCDVYWQVGTTATLGAGSVFEGSLLAGISITLDTAATSNGGVFALGATVTMDTNVVGAQSCPVPIVQSSTFLGGSSTSTLGTSSAFPSSTLSSSTLNGNSGGGGSGNTPSSSSIFTSSTLSSLATSTSTSLSLSTSSSMFLSSTQGSSSISKFTTTIVSLSLSQTSSLDLSSFVPSTSTLRCSSLSLSLAQIASISMPISSASLSLSSSLAQSMSMSVPLTSSSTSSSISSTLLPQSTSQSII